MTPKEKAKELVERFNIKVNVYYTEDSIPNIMNVPMINKSVKQLALICVDEIIISLTQYGKDSNELQNMDRELYYWNEVKQEIEKL